MLEIKFNYLILTAKINLKLATIKGLFKRKVNGPKPNKDMDIF